MATRKFYAQVDKFGYPIPGTMQSNTLGKVPPDNIEIPAADTVVGGQTEVKHKGGIRYFVRRKADGSIIPNSLFTSIKQPSGLVYEFKVLK